MFKPKTTIAGRLENSSGGAIRTHDLRVMSPTSCLCSTPQRQVGIIATNDGKSNPIDEWGCCPYNQHCNNNYIGVLRVSGCNRAEMFLKSEQTALPDPGHAGVGK